MPPLETMALDTANCLVMAEHAAATLPKNITSPMHLEHQNIPHAARSKEAVCLRASVFSQARLQLMHRCSAQLMNSSSALQPLHAPLLMLPTPAHLALHGHGEKHCLWNPVPMKRITIAMALSIQ